MKKSYLMGCVAITSVLCFAQVRASSILILSSLAAFLVLLAWTCSRNMTLPLLLYFLPWSPLMRTSPTNFSFFTFGIVLVCGISVVKKRFRFKRYHIVIGILLAFLTLLSKLLDGSWISFDYLAFLMLIVLFPVVKDEFIEQEYDFFQTVTFFSTGVILAALCAQQLAGYGNISRYIIVHSYTTITRLCGFYGDPNFYTAQVTAAMGGGFYAILRESAKRRITALGTMLLFLLYCGFLSGSKSFVLVTVVVLGIWVFEMLSMRGKTGLKIILMIVALLAAVYIASSALFGGLIDVLITRFSSATDLDSFTTHRMELWQTYMEEIVSDAKVLFLGKGFTNVKINTRSSHNTLVQMVFQLGILGAPLLLIWTGCFFKEIPKIRRTKKKRSVSPWILISGAFMPWLAIDVMFFDEFFLLQWYVFVALFEAAQIYRSEHKQDELECSGRH